MTSRTLHSVRWDRDPARLAAGLPERRLVRLAAARHRLKQGWAGAPRRGRPPSISEPAS